MANYTDSLGFNKGSAAAFPAHGHPRFTFLDVELDFAAIIAARAAAGATALAAADTLQVLRVPADCIVVSAGLQVTSAESTNTTATFDLGFTGGTPAAANAYANDAASDALGYTVAALATPTMVAAEDTIDLLLNLAAPTDAVVRVFALLVNVEA